MGLWIQNVGVRAGELPPALAARAADESFGLPAPFARGWTWTSLDDDDFLDSDELDEVAARAAAAADAPALAFSVHDSDSVYLVGADPAGVRFRVGINPAAFEAGAPDAVRGARDAAAWAAEYAPASSSEEALRDVLTRHYTFAEGGLAVLFARMGLLPADAAEDVPELGDDELADWEEYEDAGEEPDERERVDFAEWPAADDRELPAQRWYATITGTADRADRWWIVAFGEERPVEYRYLGPPELEEVSRATLVAHARDSESGFWAYLCASGERPRSLAYPSKTLEDLARELGDPDVGLPVGAWHPVPDHVPATLYATCEWVAAQAR